MTPSEYYEATHGVDNLYQAPPKKDRLYLIKFLIIFLMGTIAGYMLHILLIRGVS